MPLSSERNDRYWSAAAFVLLLLSVAVYQKALWFVPGSADDLRILSSVSHTADPISYFGTDWGMKSTYRLADGQIDNRRRSYRPLHSILIWLGYRAFGVWAYPNQLLNLILHTLNILLVLRVIRRFGLEVVPAFLLAAIGLLSLYTASPAIWVSDRQTLVVALAAILLIDHVVDENGRLRNSLNPWLVVGLTLVAVSFKESGLLIPIMAAVFVTIAPYTGPRWRHFAVCALLAVCYLGLRVALFGSNAFAYTAEGFVFGNHPYATLSDLSWQIGLWARFENTAKNFLSVFLPIFDPFGRIDSPTELFRSLRWWLPTAVLTIIATRRSITRVQWFALAIVAINSVLHVQVFRYRIEYVPQVAFCLYVAASPLWQASGDTLDGLRRQQLIGITCCCILVLVGTVQVNWYVHSNWLEREDEVTKRRLATVCHLYPISGLIVTQVLERYAPTAGPSPSESR
jgi:hypothetical protein